MPLRTVSPFVPRRRIFLSKKPGEGIDNETTGFHHWTRLLHLMDTYFSLWDGGTPSVPFPKDVKLPTDVEKRITEMRGW
ncbi:hypothetical protein TNCV_3391331 [Trichonephila clavipes]|nr:hypothetical protein TNCV_3391331 [Trichonephila clavipes]